LVGGASYIEAIRNSAERMIPILGAGQIRQVDAHTIANEPIASIDLMERAAQRCTERILHDHYQGRFGTPAATAYVVHAGMGNNGGDGLVIARLLHGAGVAVRVIRLLHRPEDTPDHAANLARVQELGIPCHDVSAVDELGDVADHEVIIDAMLGTGIDKPVTGLLAAVIKHVNRAGRPVIAIDMPSGLFTEDNTGNDPDLVVQATITLTLELPKLALLLPDVAVRAGDCTVVPIGLDREHILSLPTDHHLMEEADAVALLPTRTPWGHKGTFGHVHLIAGATGRMGAAVLATKAALRSGVGLVTAQVPGEGLPIIQVAAPEAMCVPDEGGNMLTTLMSVAGSTAIGAGPAMGMDDGTARLLKRIIQDASVPLVLDADALNILAANPTWLAFLPPGTILTPHPKEFDRLAGGTSTNAHERLQRARDLAFRNRCIVVLKGRYTAIIDPRGKVVFNPTGNPGMAKGGSGDVLTGLLAGLLAQGMDPLRSALLGVYLHGLAGDVAAAHRSMDGMTAGDLVEALPEAWRHLRNSSEEALQ
jgi:hydroxyethylthiazole kinase-like uncharacterized protein yjeF